MAQRKTEDLEPGGDELVGEEVPIWQRRSVDRSLQGARARAQDRSDRFAAAALELIEEGEVGDLTIQDVIDRSEMSLRTFYRFFDGKDSLLLAVYETILRTLAVPLLREACDKHSDPVARLKALLETMSELTAVPNAIARALSVYHLRLVETRPHDLAHALEPLRGFIAELLVGVDDAGLLRDDLDLTTQAGLLQELLLTSAHSAVLAGIRQVSAEDLWAFCSAAILRPGVARATV
jgi:AcrR family transcriptional regulator